MPDAILLLIVPVHLDFLRKSILIIFKFNIIVEIHQHRSQYRLEPLSILGTFIFQLICKRIPRLWYIVCIILIILVQTILAFLFMRYSYFITLILGQKCCPFPNRSSIAAGDKMVCTIIMSTWRMSVEWKYGCYERK